MSLGEAVTYPWPASSRATFRPKALNLKTVASSFFSTYSSHMTQMTDKIKAGGGGGVRKLDSKTEVLVNLEMVLSLLSFSREMRE